MLPALSRVLGQRRYVFSPRERDKPRQTQILRSACRPGTTMAGRKVSGRKMPLTRKPAVSACRSRCLALRGQAWHARMSMEGLPSRTSQHSHGGAPFPTRFPRGSHEAGGGAAPAKPGASGFWVGGMWCWARAGQGIWGSLSATIRRHRGETWQTRPAETAMSPEEKKEGKEQWR